MTYRIAVHIDHMYPHDLSLPSGLRRTSISSEGWSLRVNNNNPPSKQKVMTDLIKDYQIYNSAVDAKAANN